jgi:hypothetical protein
MRGSELCAIDTTADAPNNLHGRPGDWIAYTRSTTFDDRLWLIWPDGSDAHPDPSFPINAQAPCGRTRAG